MLHTRLMEPPSTPKLTANRSNRSTSSLLGWISVRWGTEREGKEGEQDCYTSGCMQWVEFSHNALGSGLLIRLVGCELHIMDNETQHSEIRELKS